MPGHAELENSINDLWEQRGQPSRPAGKKAVDKVLRLLGLGKLRIAEKTDSGWKTHQWLKKAVLLSFRIHDNAPIQGGPAGSSWYDRVPSRFQNMDEQAFKAAGFRAVPGCFRMMSTTSVPSKSPVSPRNVFVS